MPVSYGPSAAVTHALFFFSGAALGLRSELAPQPRMSRFMSNPGPEVIRATGTDCRSSSRPSKRADTCYP